MPYPLPILTAMIAIAATFFDGAVTAAAEQAPRPNIIVILSDDMGYSDIGCYGGDARTPNLDALATGGVRFTQFYNCARCCPTRASLLTGLYPHQAGIGHMTDDRGYDGYRGQLSRNAVTMAEVLRAAGYRTHMCGKWHVTSDIRPQGDKSNWPLQRGFEKFYGTITGAGSFYDPTTLCRQNDFITPENDPEYQPSEYYYTDAISDNAVRYLRQHAAGPDDKPFFLYVAYTAAHWPMHALEKDIARYRGKFDDGYEARRKDRLARMKASGLIGEETSLSPGAEDWSNVTNKSWEARCMEVYCAMIDNMDAGIGRIVAQLRESGQLDNTLILFLQDNGGCAEPLGRSPNGDGPADLKPFGKNDLQPKIWPPMQTRGGQWVQTGSEVMPGPPDTYIAYGRGWANVSNTPFREYKHWVHEGGISTPLIMHWPAALAAERRGKLEQQPGHLIDVMATCVDVARAAYPEEHAGQKIKPLEGVSLAPALRGEPLARKQPIFWEHEGNRAVRDGKWKLVAKENQPWELYDIDHDRTESTDLAASEPERVKDLAARWDAYAARANVLPLGAWRAPNQSGPSKRKFDLKSDDKLTSNQAPAIGREAFRVTAEIDVPNGVKEGVIVAQGGTALGFALFLQDGKPAFRIRAEGKAFDLIGGDSLAGKHVVVATLDRSGTMSLEVNGKAASEPVAAALVARKPAEGLEVGRDGGAAVGPYESSYPFSGTIRSVSVELLATEAK